MKKAASKCIEKLQQLAVTNSRSTRDHRCSVHPAFPLPSNFKGENGRAGRHAPPERRPVFDFEGESAVDSGTASNQKKPEK
jgi:hypothetical protein